MSDEFSVLDALTTSDRSFALYRIPGRTPILLVQTDGVPESFSSLAELNGRKGFVMAPFQTTAEHPVVLIRPDVTLHGWSQIKKYLQGLPVAAANQPTTPPVVQDLDDKDTTAERYTIYKAAFELFQKALHAGSCEKIVLSRTFERPLPEQFSAGALFAAAVETYPDAFVYLCRTPQSGTWFGSSPELLLAGESGSWQTVALAGTRRIKEKASHGTGSAETERSAEGKDIPWDAKNIREQQVVTAYLEKQLRIKNLIGSISEPYTVRAGQLMHIKTDFKFHMPDQQRVGDLLDFLHPTPAVCGYPKTEACRLILAHEGYDRSYYSGFAGPLNSAGKTDLYVNLRCARMTENGLVLYAGGGLMPDSELQSEWEETEVKLQTLLALIHSFEKN